MKNIVHSLVVAATLSTLTSNFSFAQSDTREKFLNQAKADFESAHKRFKTLVANPSSKPCDLEVAYFEKNYANWYVQNEAAIWSRYESLNKVVEYANQKIVELKQMSFRPIVERGQQNDPNVTFDTVLRYLSDLSIRKKVAKDSGQLSVFEDQATRPEFSPFELSLTQVIESLQGMSEQMNASLKDQGVEFKIQFKSTEGGYDLNLEVKIQDSPQTFVLDLLKTGQAISIEEKDRWAFLSLTKIGPYSVDTRIRYREMFTEAKSKQCLKPILRKQVRSPYQSISTLIELAEKERNSENLALSLEFVLDSAITICQMGNTGTIEFHDGKAKVTTWGGYSHGWSEAPVKISNNGNRVDIMWNGTYGGDVWIEGNDTDFFNASHGPVTCRLK